MSFILITLVRSTCLFNGCTGYSIQVTYDTSGFLEKNRDLLHMDTIQLMSSCSCHLPQKFAANMLSQSEKPVVGPLYKSGGADSQKLSVATKFKVTQVLQVMIFDRILLTFKLVSWTHARTYIGMEQCLKSHLYSHFINRPFLFLGSIIPVDATSRKYHPTFHPLYQAKQSSVCWII